MPDWTKPDTWTKGAAGEWTPPQAKGSCGHPAKSSFTMCDACVEALPKLSDDAVLRGVPPVVRHRFMRSRRG